MNNKIEYTTKRKKDYITLLALLLFALIIIFEIALVTVLPSVLKKDDIWRIEMMREDMSREIDELRGNIPSLMKGCTKLQKGEMDLVMELLNDYARYLRKYKSSTDMSQLNEINRNLKRIREYFSKWKIKEFGVAFEKLDTSQAIARAADKCGIQLKSETPSNKKDTERKDEKRTSISDSK